MSSTSLPGHLSRAALEDLIGPVQHFRALGTDALTPHYAWNLEELDDALATYSFFNFSRGGGGGELLGDSDVRVALARLKALPRTFDLYREVHSGLPHFRIERAKLGAKLRGLFGQRVRFEGPRSFNEQYVVFGEHSEEVEAVANETFRACLAKASPDFEIEIEDHWALCSRRGAQWEERDASFHAEVKTIVRALSDPSAEG